MPDRVLPDLSAILSSGEYQIRKELSGGIALDIASDHKHRHSIELAMSKNPVQTKQTLHDAVHTYH